MSQVEPTRRTSDDWFELRGPDGAPIRFVERRRRGRRRGDRPRVDVLPALNEPTPTVSLVIPTRNEARNVANVLEHLPGIVTEVVLVDGLSWDVTKLMARSSRPSVRIVDVPQPGKGNALRSGFAAATGDIVVAMDADGSMSPDEIPRFVHPLQHGFDFTKGSRFMAGGGSLDITPTRRLGNHALVSLVNALFHVRYTDLCYGFFAFKRVFLEPLGLRSTGFEIETEVTLRAQIMGLRIAEVPSVELPRRTGHSGLHATNDGMRILRTIRQQYDSVRANSAGPTAPTDPPDGTGLRTSPNEKRDGPLVQQSERVRHRRLPTSGNGRPLGA